MKPVTVMNPQMVGRAELIDGSMRLKSLTDTQFMHGKQHCKESLNRR